MNGSIKNWPSILCCCLGGVRGIGQIVNLVEGRLVVVTWTVRERNEYYVLRNERRRIIVGAGETSKGLLHGLLVYIHMLQWCTAAMHPSLYMQHERIIEGQVDSTFVP